MVRDVTNRTNLSVFDLDRTLTRAPTYSAFLIFAAWRTARWRLLLIPLLIPFAIAYAARLFPRRRMKMVMHWLMLGPAMPRSMAQSLAEAFASRLFETGLYMQAHDRIAFERQAGRRVVIATAAPSLYVVPLAAQLGIVDVVASGTEWRGEVLCPSISGENCYGAAKQRMLAAFLATHGIDRGNAHIRFFSDDASDLPSFKWADEPIVVNASPRLREIAAACKWPALDWIEFRNQKRGSPRARRLSA
jgi:HAD superfamily hydrolase (TIGR01490 family)